MTTHPFFDLHVETFADRVEQLRDHMNYLRAFDLYELTLYKKWQRMQEYRSWLNRASVIKGNFWAPKDWNDASADFATLRPSIRIVSSQHDQQTWDLATEFTSSHPRAQSPGRYVKFLIVDEPTGRYLGVMSLGSDLLELKQRDAWIGWNKENKLEHRRINHIANAHTLVPMQPFGYNFLGGKLLATLIVSPTASTEWERRWGDRLVGLTTTSLYGGQSQYNGIPFWKGMGETAGQISISPDPDMYDKWVAWLRQEHADEYLAVTTREDSDASGPPTGVKRAILNLIFKYTEIDQAEYYHGFPRGVYFCPLYTNTQEFLQEKIGIAELTPKVIPGVEWWRPKAQRRYETLVAETRVSTESVFYTDMIGMTWDQAKRKYLKVVGR